MSSRFAATEHALESRKNSAETPIALRTALLVEQAANDTPTSAFAIFGHPLWGMAMASVILFVIFAALVAFG
jgi:hypothetical protein